MDGGYCSLSFPLLSLLGFLVFLSLALPPCVWSRGGGHFWSVGWVPWLGLG